ncbi:MAG: NUDIX hydrolase [Bacteroidota bacterium]
MILKLLPAGQLPDESLEYVIICAREEGEWLFVRHRERESWEIPAGHIEPGETAGEASVRELFEETGALNYTIRPVFDYCLSGRAVNGCGRVFLAAILQRGPLPPSEIAEVIRASAPPQNLTYPEVQPWILKKVRSCMEQQEFLP